ncbi:lipopolysaccharide core biosynthesis family protein [Escherichia coli DEC7B]|nr:lipopolysaccharide core biosynthesis family protein [Escherichia coli DEC7B]
MIYNKTINGLKVFIKDNDPFYEQVLNDFLTCRVKALKVFRSIDDTKVILIDTARGPLVLKVYAPKHKMTERFLKSCIKKDYYENLIYQTDRVRGEGIQSINDYFLLAERKTLNFAHYYIMLIEYIEGVGLNEYLEISEDLKDQLSESIKELHQHGMVSGDPHKGNFIVSEKGLRLMNPLMILVKIIKLRWIHILSYDQMVSRKINNQTTRCANSIFYTTLFTNSAPNYT